MVKPIVEFRGIDKKYDDTKALDRIDLSIGRGEFVVLLGPSGSGKTTMLSILGGFISPTDGQVFIDGADVTDLTPAQRPTATVFQDYALFPHMNVSKNIAFGLSMHKVPQAERAERVEEVLNLVGLEDFGGRGIHQLSGGQQQRVALARAIAIRPTVLLLDEPLGALDLSLRRQMQEELVRIQKSLGTTFIHVTHDQEEAMSIADTIVVLNRGRIEDQGSPRRVYLNPKSLFSATFLGESNIIPGTILGTDGGRTKIDTPFGAWLIPQLDANTSQVWLVLKPEHVRIGKAVNGSLSMGFAHVTDIVFQGANIKVFAKCEADGQDKISLQLPPDREVTVSSRIPIYATPADLVVVFR